MRESWFSKVRRPGAWKGTVVVIAAAIWLAGIGFGGWRVWRFESSAGAVGSTPQRWPSDSKLVQKPMGTTLLMFVHPECSCTRASLEELAQVVEQSTAPMRATVVIVQPAIGARMDTWEAATRIPGIEIDVDPTGEEAARFGALTSGYVVVYDPSGELRFSGGLTAARGHEGYNLGRQSVSAALANQHLARATHAVFGCPLSDAAVADTGAPLHHSTGTSL